VSERHADEEAGGFELVTLAGGVRSLRARDNGQVFHPVVGPVAEATAVHVAGGQLVERVAALRAQPFVIWDVGLGAAANALTAIEALLAAGGRLRGRRVELFSFDRSCEPLRFARQHAEELGYPRGREAWLDALLAARAPVEIGADALTLRWVFVQTNFAAMAPRGWPAPHAIFFDPYSPAVNPEMWTLALFERLRGEMGETPCVLTTYSRSTAVRVGFLLAGFFVGIGAATGEKEETTVASNERALLAQPLDRRWLETTVRHSTNAAPLRNAVFSRRPIGDADFTRLRRHPQFYSEANSSP